MSWVTLLWGFEKLLLEDYLCCCCCCCCCSPNKTSLVVKERRTLLATTSTSLTAVWNLRCQWKEKWGQITVTTRDHFLIRILRKLKRKQTEAFKKQDLLKNGKGGNNDFHNDLVIIWASLSRQIYQKSSTVLLL